MREFLDKVLKQIGEFFRNMQKKDRIRLIVLAVVIIILAIVVSTLLSRTSYGILYADLTAEEAGTVADALTAMGVDYRTQGTSVILVPESQVGDIKMQLAFQGLMGSDNFNADIFAQATGFGSTDFEKQAYYQWQVAENIRKQIKMINSVKDCAVIIDPPETSKYAVSSVEDTFGATVMLELNNALSEAEASQIANLVATNTGISKERVVIMDTSMKTYYAEADGYGGVGGVDQQIALTNQMQRLLTQQAESILDVICGPDNYRAQAAVELNFDTVVSESIEYAPPVAGSEEGLIVSIDRLLELQRLTAEAEGVPGTDSNGLGTVEYPYGELGDAEDYKKAAETVNYELNQTITQIEEAKGTVKRLSLSVVIDSNTLTDDTYLNDITNLISTATGAPVELITVARMPFDESGDTTIQDANERTAAEQRNQLIEMIINGLLVALLIGAGFMFMMTMLRAVVISRRKAVAAAIGPGASVDIVAGDGMGLNIDDIDLTAKSEDIQALEKFIDKDPAAVASLLRNWLSDDI